MNKIKIRVRLLLAIGFMLSACGYAQPKIIATSTSVNAAITENRSSKTPTPTLTYTPVPTNTQTPEATPIASATVNIIFNEKDFFADVSVLLDLDDFSSALDLCTEVLYLDPSFAEAHALRGIIHYIQENYEVAISDFDKAIELGITDDLEIEIYRGLSIKTLYYFRGFSNIFIGAYENGVKDLEHFLEITDSSEYSEYQTNALYTIAGFKEAPVPVSSGQRIDFPYYSIESPDEDGWGVAPNGPMSIRFARVDKLDSGDSVYSELSTIGVSYVDITDEDYSDGDFLEYACSIMELMNILEGRIEPIETTCDWTPQFSTDCVMYQSSVEDHGGVDRPYSPPLIIKGKTITCRHPEFNNAMIILQFTQRGPRRSLEDDIFQQADAFFKGLSFNNPEE